MKIKITGISDDLKQVASLLINESIGFKYDGENEIVADSHLTHRGIDLTEKLVEYLPTLKTVKVKSI